MRLSQEWYVVKDNNILKSGSFIECCGFVHNASSRAYNYQSIVKHKGTGPFRITNVKPVLPPLTTIGSADIQITPYTVGIQYGKSVDKGYEHTANKIYEFSADINLKVGDTVVVENRNGDMKIVTVGSVDKSKAPTNPDCWVIDRVDMSRHRNREFNARRRLDALDKLQRYVAGLPTEKKIEMLASVDPEVNRMLTELKSI